MPLARLVLAFFACHLLLAATARAEKAANLQPTHVKAGKAAAEEKFEGSALPKAFTVNKGTWQTMEGVLVGWEKKEDMHAAVLTLAKPFKSTAIRFSFMRDGATGFNLSFNHPKGHLFRVVINDEGLVLNKDKDKKDPNSKPQTLAKAEGKFATGQWHTILVEVHGDKVWVTADNGAKLEGSHPGLALDKTGYRFVTRGSKLLIDDLTVWAVEP
jgi:hypothetical protein